MHVLFVLLDTNSVQFPAQNYPLCITLFNTVEYLHIQADHSHITVSLGTLLHTRIKQLFVETPGMSLHIFFLQTVTFP
jgi:hypothetical protein